MSASSYAALGLQPTASKEQVKDAFRKLCLTHHPDKCPADMRAGAEARFREIKGAYDAILKGQAGYAPPKPGSRPSASSARAWSEAHNVAYEGGPVKVGGPFGGYATEWDFYRAMFRRGRNNPALIIGGGLLAIPFISLITSVANGETEFIKRFRDEGLNVFSDQRYKVNGRTSVVNPFSIRDLGNEEESYLYKSDKYKNLRGKAKGDSTSYASGGEVEGRPHHPHAPA